MLQYFLRRKLYSTHCQRSLFKTSLLLLLLHICHSCIRLHSALISIHYYFKKKVRPDPCLLLPCLGAGHDHSVILGKLRNTRLDCFSQELRELMVELNFSIKIYYLYLYNLYSKLELCESNTLNSWLKLSNLVFLNLPKISEWSCPAPRHGRSKHGSVLVWTVEWYCKV